MAPVLDMLVTPERTATAAHQAEDAGLVHLRDGRTVVVRSARLEDAPRLAKLCAGLSAESSRFRFFRAGRRLTAHEAVGVVTIDRRRHEAILALSGDAVVGWGSFTQIGNDRHAELTLLVDDAYQGAGLGRHILERLI